MANRFKLVALALAALSGAVHAGYAQLAPPRGFSGSGSSLAYTASNASEFLTGTVRTNASLNVGGRAISVPVMARIAANAPRLAASTLFSPLGVAAAGALVLAPIIADLFNNHQIQWNEQAQRWERQTGGSLWGFYQNTSVLYSSQDAACSAFQTWWNATNSSHPSYMQHLGWRPDGDPQKAICRVNEFRRADGSLHEGPRDFGWVQIYENNAPTVEALTQAQFEDAVLPYIDPEDVPDLVPGKAIPVEQPVINPSADPLPVPQPLRVPQGNPVPVPNTNPQQYRQPMARITPSPTVAEPWRVDVTPEDVVSESPTGQANPEPVTEESPSGEPTDGDLCTKNPDILACQKVTLGDLDPVPVIDEARNMSITPDSGWGPSSAACPADINMSLAGGTLTIPWSFGPMCTFAEGIKPVVIAMAWFVAALTFFGFSRKGD